MSEVRQAEFRALQARVEKYNEDYSVVDGGTPADPGTKIYDGGSI